MKRHSERQRNDLTCESARRNHKLVAACAALLTIALLLSMVAPTRAYGASSGEKAHSATVLVYMNGSDLESEAGLATADIAEMIGSGAGDKVKVVIETLGTRQWQRFDIASDHTQRHLVRDGRLELVDDTLGQLDTTSADTLSDFIDWGVRNYPADRYLLLFWDHGAGPVYGFGYDEFQDEAGALTLDEMCQALEANRQVHFDLIGMDCCIMGSLETCLALAPYCDYTVLSEDFEPGVGWGYERWLATLESDPAIDTRTLGTAIADDMVAGVEADDPEGAATLALVDESQARALMSAWTAFAYANEDELLSRNYSHQTVWDLFPTRRACGRDGRAPSAGTTDRGYSWQGRPDGCALGPEGPDVWDRPPFEDDPDDLSAYDGLWDFWDLWDSDPSDVTMCDYYVTDVIDVATAIGGDEAKALRDAFERAVVHVASTDAEVGMEGLGVTLPYGDAVFYDQLQDVFAKVGIDRTYLTWLGAFVETEGADDFFDFDHDITGDDDRDALGLVAPESHALPFGQTLVTA